jgi:5-methyltetrahydropteroyltriglutamate--homocysteine methyltransferase
MPDLRTFRADHIGSLLRPQSVLDARRRADAGQIDAAELRAVEDAAIADAVRLQQEAGIDVITDGEFRRKDFRAGFVDAFDGITTTTVQKPWQGPDGPVLLPSVQFTVTERLRQKRRLAAGEADHLRTLTSSPIKVTLISPGFLVDRFWKDDESGAAYDSREAFAADVIAATRREIEALIAEGVDYVQLDNPGYAAFLDDRARERARAAGGDPDAAFERMLAADIAAVEGIERGDDVTIGLHVCRGNQSSLWLAEGDYEPIAEQLFGRLPVDRFLVEYDDERAGGFEPLRFVPAGKVVVLGLVSTKTARVESVDEIVGRMEQAARVVDADHLALSPQCGFASVAEGGNDLTAEVELAKLRLVAEAAQAMWGATL